ncbi:MAG: aldolase [Actinomycetota bacterium]
MTDARTDRSGLDALRRPSGAFAMLAVDQREALRVMMTEALGADEPVDDAAVLEFKLTAARLLTPFASAVLIDRQFAWDAAVEAGVVADGCGLISSADLFVPAHGQLVGEVEIDRLVDPARVRDQGAVAMKLLVLHRIDQSADARRAMVDEFVGRCDGAGLASIIEPVCRPPLDPSLAWDHDDAIIAAAEELGSRGADLYKGEMPLQGAGDEAEMRERCRAISAAVASPWVILSSGVAESDFPTAVRVAAEEGASGFLAGRAVWASCLGAPDVAACLRGAAATRLQEFAAAADRAVSAR